MNSSIPETTENKKIDEGETNSAEKSLGYSSDLSDNEGNDKKKGVKLVHGKAQKEIDIL